MSLFSEKEVLNLKLSCIPLPQLRELASILNLPKKGSATEIIKEILDSQIANSKIDNFIKKKYEEKIKERKSIISDEDLKNELNKVENFSWGVVQGQLDQKIQAEYVRRIVRYNDLIDSVKAKLHNDVTNYVVCSWFNHWTTVLIEEHISFHKKVIPTIKSVKGIDFFFDGQPFDLKITYLPKGVDPKKVVENPKELVVWMYENQGEQRFGADNRMFVVLLDINNPAKSWEIKRDFDFVFQEIDKFFDKEKVSEEDEIAFKFKKKTYTAVTKVLLIKK
ncbi:MAG: hypothetical protein ACP5Q5_02325 [Brevinematia bacterium]